jgi:hypothetical protein
LGEEQLAVGDFNSQFLTLAEAFDSLTSQPVRAKPATEHLKHPASSYNLEKKL